MNIKKPLSLKELEQSGEAFSLPVDPKIYDEYINEEQYIVVHPMNTESAILSDTPTWSVKDRYEQWARTSNIVCILLCKNSTSDNAFNHLSSLGLPVKLVDFREYGITSKFLGYIDISKRQEVPDMRVMFTQDNEKKFLKYHYRW